MRRKRRGGVGVERENEGMDLEDEDNELIYSREVKPLVSAAFDGHNSTVIAHGARGSGKTHVIQV